MLLRLLRRALPPYAGYLAAIALLQLVGVLATLYLPSLNGRIIDEGVARGDTGFIVTAGTWMLAVSLVQIAVTVAATYLGARTAAGMGRDLRAGVFAQVADGRLDVRIGARYGLDEVSGAYEDLEARRTTGKSVVLPR